MVWRINYQDPPIRSNRSHGTYRTHETYEAMMASSATDPPRAHVCFCGTQNPYSRVPVGSEVKYKIGNERLVKVTARAAAKLSQLLQRQGRPQGALRVAVIGGGCSGLRYTMHLVE